MHKTARAQKKGGAYMLTPKEEQYCKNRAIKKMSQRKAYRAAYKEAETWQDNSVDVEACKLETETKILLRIKELQDELKREMLKEAAWTRQDALNELKALIDRAKKEMDETGSMSGPNVSAIVNSVKELDAIYEVTAEKTELNNDGFIEALNGQAKEVWNDEEQGDIPV